MYNESIKVIISTRSLDRSLIRYIIKLATNVDPSFTFVHSALKGIYLGNELEAHIYIHIYVYVYESNFTSARRRDLKDRSKFASRWLIRRSVLVISSIVPFSYLYYEDDHCDFIIYKLYDKEYILISALYDTPCINIYLYIHTFRSIKVYNEQ